MSFISLDDAVAGILFLLDKPDVAGAVNLTAPTPVTNQEFTRSLGRAVHRPALIPAPAFALRLAFGQMADEALLASARILPAKLGGAGFRFAHPTVDAALAACLQSPKLG
jgi:NAD dependent epimerase/dehydratase family enzyme